MYKKWVFLLALAAIFFAGAAYADATQHVVDDARIFSAAQVNTLEDAAESLYGDTGLDLLVVTTNDSQGRTVEEFAQLATQQLRNTSRYPDGSTFVFCFDLQEYHELLRGKAKAMLGDWSDEDLIAVVGDDMDRGNYQQALSKYIDQMRRAAGVKSRGAFPTASTSAASSANSEVVLPEFGIPDATYAPLPTFAPLPTRRPGGSVAGQGTFVEKTGRRIETILYRLAARGRDYRIDTAADPLLYTQPNGDMRVYAARANIYYSNNDLLVNKIEIKVDKKDDPALHLLLSVLEIPDREYQLFGAQQAMEKTRQWLDGVVSRRGAASASGFAYAYAGDDYSGYTLTITAR